jgi:hypothetical protein
MNIYYKTEPSEKGKVMLESLQQAVTKALERKRRLGQYSFTWKNGKVIISGDDAPKTHEDSD